jgi:hypothetical protein
MQMAEKRGAARAAQMGARPSYKTMDDHDQELTETNFSLSSESEMEGDSIFEQMLSPPLDSQLPVMKRLGPIRRSVVSACNPSFDLKDEDDTSINESILHAILQDDDDIDGNYGMLIDERLGSVPPPPDADIPPSLRDEVHTSRLFNSLQAYKLYPYISLYVLQLHMSDLYESSATMGDAIRNET